MRNAKQSVTLQWKKRHYKKNKSKLAYCHVLNFHKTAIIQLIYAKFVSEQANKWKLTTPSEPKRMGRGGEKKSTCYFDIILPLYFLISCHKLHFKFQINENTYWHIINIRFTVPSFAYDRFNQFTCNNFWKTLTHTNSTVMPMTNMQWCLDYLIYQTIYYLQRKPNLTQIFTGTLVWGRCGGDDMKWIVFWYEHDWWSNGRSLCI